MKLFFSCGNQLVKNTIISLVLLSGAVVSHADPIDLNTLIPDAPKITAPSYILIDYYSGQVLVEHYADERRNPASLTKMMTSYLIGQAIKSHKISPEDNVVISDNARTTNPIFRDSSLMWLEKGKSVKVSDLNRGIIIQSGNDACVAMAEHVAGSQDTFISLMNTAAKSLGMTNSHFATVHGLDADGQYSSAHDMAKLAQALIRDVPNEYAVYKEKEFTFSNIKQRNRNGLLWDTSLNVDGVKTGHTSTAGYNLVSSATQGNMRLIAVVMGSANDSERQAQSKQLLTWGFRYHDTLSPLQTNKPFVTQRVWFGDTSHAALGINHDTYVTIPRGRNADLKANYTLSNTELVAPLEKGQIVGKITFSMDNNVISEYPLVVLNSVPEGGFFSRLIDHILLLFHRWFN